MMQAQLKGTPLPLVEGESVYCLNQRQITEAQRLVFSDTATAGRLESELERIERDFGRNERAALAFVLIDRMLRDGSGH